MSERALFRGIYCPNVVPLDAEGAIDEAEFRRYLDWLVDRGVHGLYPNGSTGEFTRFTAEERRRIIEIAIDQAAGRVPVLAGAAEANVRETLAACETYAGLGADAVAIVSPFYYPLSAESVYAYFLEIGRNTPIDVTLYNIPMFASPIDIDTVRRLSEDCARIVAIKDSSGDLPFMMNLIETVRPNRPDFRFLTGSDACLLPMLLMGCDGGINATSGVAPDLTRQLYESVLSGRLEEARRLQLRVARLFDALFTVAEFPDGFRMGVGLRGFRAGTGRTPRSERQRAAEAATRERLSALLQAEDLA
jgi:4-hydroxy-tetrahydrodipicolinate synthase